MPPWPLARGAVIDHYRAGGGNIKTIRLTSDLFICLSQTDRELIVQIARLVLSQELEPDHESKQDAEPAKDDRQDD